MIFGMCSWHEIKELIYTVLLSHEIRNGLVLFVLGTLVGTLIALI